MAHAKRQIIVSSQPRLFAQALQLSQPPSTRYQGSKLKLLPWIWENVSNIQFRTVLDAFGGTGSVSYLFKAQGKAVTYNDYLKFNEVIGTALIENSKVNLTDTDIEFLLARNNRTKYDNFISETFAQTYFTDDENVWLDRVCQNVHLLEDKYKQALAFYALFQACIIKRPYNLFHRKNLYIRTANVARGFGNKTTWDKPFEKHFRNFVYEANKAVFDSGVPCRAIKNDALEVPGKYDLVYIDTPYLNKSGVGVDYLDFYHFLEGMTDYSGWADKLNRKKKHLPLKGPLSMWSGSEQILSAFEKLFSRFSDSILVVSYRSDGIPSEEELVKLLKSIKRNVRSVRFGRYKYVLSTNKASDEILLIAS